MHKTINSSDFRNMILVGAKKLEINRAKVDALNVFPVPDGDTGTNMSMTINAAAADLRKVEDPSLEKAAATAASAMLRGARGNSGVILSLLFRGISKRLKGVDCQAAVLYGIQSIPYTLLIDQEGTILARNIRGEAIEKKLEELLK